MIMAGMLGSTVKKKGALERGAKIVTQSDVTKEIILQENPKSQRESISTGEIPANIRVDQGIRNTINALGIIGYGDSQKEVIQFLLDSTLPILTSDQRKKLDDLTAIYDEKDQKALAKKRK